MRIGIYGGTFDPPHLGHLILADEARNQLQIDRLLWVLAAHPPHKQQQEVSPLSQRLELIRAAIASEPCFELSTVDIDRAGPHYALDTVRIISAQFPGEEITYIMGGDSLRDLPNWHMPLQLMQACTWIGVMRRPDDDVHLTTLEKCLPGISTKVMFLDTPPARSALELLKAGLFDITSLCQFLIWSCSEVTTGLKKGNLPCLYYLINALLRL